MREQEDFSDLDLFDEVNKESSGLKSKDVDKVVSMEKQINKKTESLNVNNFWKFFKQIRVMFQMIKDYKNHIYTDIPWKSILLLVAAILYFLNPFDLIPDSIPLIGFTDDAAAVAIIFTTMRKEILKYCDWKGISAEELF